MNGPAETHAERLAWDMGSWRAIELQVRETLVNDAAGDDPRLYKSAVFTTRYVETVTGLRMLQGRTIPAEGNETSTSYYSDGTRAADVHRSKRNGQDHESVQIKRTFGREAKTGWHECPQPLFYYYHELRPLHEVLAKAKHLGTGRHLDRDCDLFILPKAGGVIPVCFLDQKTSVPVKVVSYLDEQARAEDRPDTVWSATSLDEVQGHHIPLSSKMVRYARTEPHNAIARHEIVVEAVHYDRDYPRAMFWPKIGPEAHVLDLISGKLSQAHAPKSAIPLAATTGEATTSPIRAVEDGNWTGAVPTITVGLGLVLLTAGVVLWWRRR